MNKASYLLGVILLLAGVTFSLFVGNWLQTVGIILIVAGIAVAFLGLFYTLKKTPVQASITATRQPEPATILPSPTLSEKTTPAPQISTVKDPTARLQDLRKLLDHKLITP